MYLTSTRTVINAIAVLCDLQVHKRTAFDILERFDGWAIDYGIGQEGAITL
ncbi:MAG: hypothetical protein V7K25_08790 [Nostoc sp.]|uniref:hypothetical protein n=1 Tax=Nostoc sp. TaxID=1180 RepID=UPI002FF6DC44